MEKENKNLTNEISTLNKDLSMYKGIYNSLLYGMYSRADEYYVLADFDSYCEAHRKINDLYKDQKRWAQMSLMNIAGSGKFSSDRTIEEYVNDIWHLDKITNK